jgi:hypothetical protein
MDKAPVQVEGRGKSTWVPQRERPVRMDAADRTADLKQVLQSAEHTINVTQPVVHHDLHELAAKKTQELVERDKLVSAAAGACVQERTDSGRVRTRPADRPAPWGSQSGHLFLFHAASRPAPPPAHR